MRTRSVSLVVLFVAMLFGFSPSCRGQDDPVITTLDSRVDRFFDNLADVEVEPEEAFNDLLADGPLKDQLENIRKLVDRVEKFKEQYGPYAESERVDAKQIGRDLVLLKYLYKAEKYPVVWRFTFYRPPSAGGAVRDWVVISLKIDTHIDLLGI